jgi:hypothetical protein
VRIDINEGICICSPLCSQIAEAGNMGEDTEAISGLVDKTEKRKVIF